MNCYKGVCKHKERSGVCELDGVECDYKMIDNSCKFDTCRIAEDENNSFNLSCRNACKTYYRCIEV